MTQESFLSHRRLRWLKIFGLALVGATIAYCLTLPIGGRRGDSGLGYTLGTISAVGMACLMYYARRKRSYYTGHNTLKGSLSFHVWLGSGLILLVPLHSGFSFHWNIHTLAYLLMLITIVTGWWGAYMYISLAPEIESHRGGGSIKVLRDQIEDVLSEIKKLSVNRSPEFDRLRQSLDLPIGISLLDCLRTKNLEPIDPKVAGKLLPDLPESEGVDALKLIRAIDRRIDLTIDLHEEVRTLFWLRIWLYFHVPIATLASVAVLAHIFAVFYFY